MKQGDTLIIAAPGASLDSHLWIVLSDPQADPEQVVFVSITSHRDDKDQACILDVGDHRFVKHKSCIEYRRCKIGKLADFVALLAAGKIAGHDPLRPEILQRVLDGVPDSFMPLGAVAILEAQGFVDLG